MIKFIVCSLLGLAYLYVVLTFPSFTLGQNNLRCENYGPQEYNFAFILLESEINFDFVAIVFSVISGFLFLIILPFKSKILKIKQSKRMIFLPISFYGMYGFLIFNLLIFNVTTGLCYTSTYVYYLNFSGTMLFVTLCLFLSLFNEKWNYDLFYPFDYL